MKIIGILFMFACFAIFFAIFGMVIHGLIAAFYASILLGIIFLVVPPAPLVLGICIWFGGNNWALEAVEFMNLPF